MNRRDFFAAGAAAMLTAAGVKAKAFTLPVSVRGHLKRPVDFVTDEPLTIVGLITFDDAEILLPILGGELKPCMRRVAK